MNQYKEIPSPPDLSAKDLAGYGWKQNSDNDKIDNLLLHAVARGAVHMLVSNDKEIHKKAKDASIQEQVYRVDQFLAFLKNQDPDSAAPPIGIEERYLHEYDVAQGFFNSLRSAYGDNSFDEWYRKSAQKSRKAWCISKEGQLLAMCIYKEEDAPTIVDNGSSLGGKALKLCTFKVDEQVRGRKLGERLLSEAFKYADANKIPYIYLHTFGEEQDTLVSLCEGYGFDLSGQYNGSEQVYLKQMNPPSEGRDNPLAYAIKYYPHFFDGSSVKKYIVPIVPQYHNDLFADTSDNAKGLFANDYTQYSAQSNTIKKAYICHSNVKKMQQGDLLLFYRSRDRKNVQCVGIVEHVYRGKDVGTVTPLVSKRTVYNPEQLRNKLSKEALVILFRFLRSFPPVTQKMLEENGIVGPIQSIRQITDDQYEKCFKNVIIKR
jgi:ribosomal protein S18 acetylase RimI-like enzyme